MSLRYRLTFLTNKSRDFHHTDHKTSCPVGYTQTETFCYKYLAEAFNLFTADQACDVIDGKVVEVTSAHEQQLVEQYLSTQTNINNSHALVWLGATDLQVEGNYLYMSSHVSLIFSRLILI